MSRRTLVVVVALAVVGAAVWVGTAKPWESNSKPKKIEPTAQAVTSAEATRRSRRAAVHEVNLAAAPAKITIGDQTVETWAFNGVVPAPEIRLRAGDVVRAHVSNRLPAPLTVHWHGIALRNDMDGVPGVTQKAIPPGKDYDYEFTAPDPGTYFYHPHTGTALDRGLYGPLIVEDPSATPQPEVTVLIDDWIDGTGETPDQVYERLQKMAAPMGHDMSGMSGMDGRDGTDRKMPAPEPGADKTEGSSSSSVLGPDTGDVDYPTYLINGRPPSAAAEYDVAAGQPVRLRLVNAGSDTPFRVAVGGSKLTVVATDGFAVDPVTVDSVLIGMGERYDVLATLRDSGAFPLVARAEGKKGAALAVLRTGPGPVPAPGIDPAELRGTLLTLDALRASRPLAAARVDRNYRVQLTGSMAPYKWGLKAPAEDGVTLPVRAGERVRLTIDNAATMMWHPIHLHGHTFQVVGDRRAGPRKDTVIVPPMGKITVEFEADNPGQWALHCHNIYHAGSGMVTVLSYVE